jgi:hypothetical protein
MLLISLVADDDLSQQSLLSRLEHSQTDLLKEELSIQPLNS